jgi:hypothetical protein
MKTFYRKMKLYDRIFEALHLNCTWVRDAGINLPSECPVAVQRGEPPFGKIFE